MHGATMKIIHHNWFHFVKEDVFLRYELLKEYLVLHFLFCDVKYWRLLSLYLFNVRCFAYSWHYTGREELRKQGFIYVTRIQEIRPCVYFVWWAVLGIFGFCQHRLGTAVVQWLRCCATIRKVAGSIPAGVSGFFIDIKSFWSLYGPEVDSTSNRNEYQEYFLWVKASGA